MCYTIGVAISRHPILSGSALGGYCFPSPSLAHLRFARSHNTFPPTRVHGFMAQRIPHVPSAEEENLWIFGFGSLVHNPGFEFTDKAVGYIRGWRRVFYQGSTDHRGTPEAPGRTVTLIPDADAITWGAAYKLAGNLEHRLQTIQYLEWREKQYDLRQRVDVYGKSDPSHPLITSALVYIATPDTSRNPNWLGPAPVDEIAAQIAVSKGPSGHNWEYLFKLAAVMREMEVDDEELFVLEAKVKQQLAALEQAGSELR